MAPSNKSPAQKAPSSPIKNGYLILYNTVSALAWGLVLQSTVQTLVQSGPESVYLTTGEFTKWTQTAAAMEILHSLFGTQIQNKDTFPATQTSHLLVLSNTHCL
jgi:very-long-chain (3R)-3-hydroxyacyl-CoA dehydratase